MSFRMKQSRSLTAGILLTLTSVMFKRTEEINAQFFSRMALNSKKADLQNIFMHVLDKFREAKSKEQ